MDKFRTQVIIPESTDKISYQTKCLLMGSCFSDYIGEIMSRFKLPVLLNPFGTLFNPLSIADNLERLISKKEFSEDELQVHNGLWFSFSHYTGFSRPDRDTCLKNINDRTSYASSWLKDCRYLILTFGTAWCYTYKPTGNLVANCHKLPSGLFGRTFADPQSIIERYNNLLSLLQHYNPSIKVIFTLSPVRHWKDGAINNQLSKSVLHLSIHEILKKYANTAYFPAYEIFMDELRDYRFYAADMLHPSEQGAHYVWERFCDTCLEPSTKKIMSEVDAVTKSINHRPMFSGTDNYKTFQQNTLKKIEKLIKAYPFLDFTAEISSLSQ